MINSENSETTDIINPTSNKRYNNVVDWADRSTLIRWNSWILQSGIFFDQKEKYDCMDERDHVNWGMPDVDRKKITPKLDLASLKDVSSTFEVTKLTAPTAMANRLASLVVTSDAIFSNYQS
jgi:hypothetical protein